MHTSFAGFVAGPKGEMDWLKLDEDMLDFVATMTKNADTALYGRVTYELMESYWPKAVEQPNATKHAIEHSKWYEKVPIAINTNRADTAVHAEYRPTHHQSFGGQPDTIK